MTKELSEEQFIQSFGNDMIDFSKVELDDPVDIWNYVGELVDLGLIDKLVHERNLVESVYRNDLNTFDHIMLPTTNKNIYMVIVVDLKERAVFGHHLLDMTEKYRTD